MLKVVHSLIRSLSSFSLVVNYSFSPFFRPPLRKAPSWPSVAWSRRGLLESTASVSVGTATSEVEEKEEKKEEKSKEKREENENEE